MKQSQVFMPTLKEVPAGAEARSHQLMLRAGFIRQVSAGVYAYLPLAYRVIQNIEKIVREEMENVDAVEMLNPAIIPADIWKQSGRYDTYGDNLFKFKDRHERDFILGPTHEETMTYLVKDSLNSYKKMPKLLYQIQSKYRDEDRPRYGLLRCREFIMQDAYSFTSNYDDLDTIFDKMENAYRTIYNRCGLNYRVILGDSGDMGGNGSKEFSAVAAIGEDTIAYSDTSDYAANLETATSIIPGNKPETPADIKKVDTPDTKSVDAVAKLLGQPINKVIKGMAYIVDGNPVLVLLRGDHKGNDTKLKNVLGANNVREASLDEIHTTFKSEPGFIGPVKIDKTVKVVADNSVKDLNNAIVGANEKDKHFINVNADRDYKPESYDDIRVVEEGEQSPDSKGALKFTRGIEIGHIFKLGTRYSKSLDANFLDKNGRQQPIIMGCYGIGISRLLSAVIEQHSDENGMIWPLELAPYQIHVIPVNVKKDDQVKLASEVEQMLTDAGYSVLVDDRKERAGVKFAESDLIGLPVRITVGKKASDGIVEIKLRNQDESVEVPKNDVLNSVGILLKNYK